MYIVNHQEHCGEYRYCPERHAETVSLGGHSCGQDGLRFSIRGAKIRMGYFFRISGMIGRAIRKRVVQLSRRYRIRDWGHRPHEMQRVLCCARL